MWVGSVSGCTHLSTSVYLITCLHSDRIVVMCVLLVNLRHFFQDCWRVARKTWWVFERELKRMWFENLYFDLALEVNAEHPDLRCGWVFIEARTFNEMITKYSILHQAVLMRQLRSGRQPRLQASPQSTRSGRQPRVQTSPQSTGIPTIYAQISAGWWEKWCCGIGACFRASTKSSIVARKSARRQNGDVSAGSLVVSNTLRWSCGDASSQRAIRLRQKINVLRKDVRSEQKLQCKQK